MSRKFDIIAAVDEDLGIGKDGRLPWAIKADMQHFKALTIKAQKPGHQNAVIMGRVTWESIPERFRPLPGRLNLVVSNTKGLALPPGVLKVSGLDEALTLLGNKYSHTIENVYVIGGAKLYQAAILHPQCQQLYLTRIQRRFGCDAFFPKAREAFLRLTVSPVQEEAGVFFCFETYGRGA